MATEEQLRLAQRLRRDPRPADSAIWALIQKKRLGVRFRQKAILFSHIVDFYAPRIGLVLEIDSEGAPKSWKCQELEAHGLTVLRITERQLLSNPKETAAAIRVVIEAKLRELPRRSRPRPCCPRRRLAKRHGLISSWR